MKKLLGVLAVAVLVAQCTPTVSDNTSTSNSPVPQAEVTNTDGKLDRSIPPKAGPAPKINIGEYQSFKLSNGTEVIVVENTKIPRVSFQISLDIDPIMEGDKAGLVGVVGDMMSRGTKNRTKQQIDEQIDFIGGSLSTSGSGVFGSSLTKHQDKLLELMSDVLLNPTFPEKELEKVKTQTKSGIASGKDDPNAISSNVSSVLNYSKNHPYGEIVTEETIDNIARKDVKNYYDAYFKPDVAQLIVVGDVDAEALQEQMEKYFGKWKSGEVPTHEYDMPMTPKANEVAFVNKEGAVQSVITITYPIDLKPGSDDAIAASVMNTILGGGGFSGYLMQNLREDKGYTYGAYSSLRRDEMVGSFSASASVRNEVTDSAVTEFFNEMERIRTEKVDEDKLQRILNRMTGSFARSLERPQTVANFALNIVRYNLPDDYYETYLEKLNAVTTDDVLRVAQKYVRPDNAHILVVGNKDEVSGSLKKFSKSGKVNFYDFYGDAVEDTGSNEPINVTAEQVLDKYIEAIGGDNWNKVEDFTKELEISFGPMSLPGTETRMMPDKFKLEVSMQGNPVQQLIYNGKQATSLNPQTGQVMKLEGADLEDAKNQAVINVEGKYLEMGYNVEVKGVEKVGSEEAYKLIVTQKNGKKTTEYYSKESGLKLKEISTQESPQGPVNVVSEFSEYKEFGGVKFATVINQTVGPQQLKMMIKDVKVNTSVSADIFKID